MYFDAPYELNKSQRSEHEFEKCVSLQVSHELTVRGHCGCIDFSIKD